MQEKKRSHWSGKLGFILAAAGSAIGLGNLWKFPYIAWKNGGGLFILIFLVCIVLVGLPIMFSELALGKISQKGPVGAFKKGGKAFPFIGVLGVLTGFVILSYYSIVAGWSLQYTFNALDGSLSPDSQKIERLAIQYKSELAVLAIATTNLGDLQSEDIAMLKFDAQLTSMIGLAKSQKAHTLLKTLQSHVTVQRVQFWRDYFLRVKEKTSDYNDWLQKSVMSIHSDRMFTDFAVHNKPKVILWHSVFMLGLMAIVLMGIQGGIEMASKILMPLLFVFILLLVINSLSIDSEMHAIKFLFVGDASKVHWGTSVLEALGHAFFTLSLGMGAMLTYGSYLKEDANLLSNSLWVVGMDTFIAFMACLMIFPIIFVYGWSPNSPSIGLLFTKLPLELLKFPMGGVLMLVFYLLVLFAALTSAISLLEVVVTYFIDEKNFSRFKATLIAGCAIYLCGLPSGLWLNFLDFADSLATNIMLPLGGLLTVLYVGYKYDLDLLKHEIEKYHYPHWTFPVFRFLVRYITPALIAVVMVNMIWHKYLA